MSSPTPVLGPGLPPHHEQELRTGMTTHSPGNWAGKGARADLVRLKLRTGAQSAIACGDSPGLSTAEIGEWTFLRSTNAC